MAKRVIILLVAFTLFMVPFAFAQPRSANPVEGKTSFGSIEATGMNQGAPGYLLLTNTSGARFYFWIGTDGKLRYASESEVTGNGTTPDLQAWLDASGPIVGP